MRSITPFKTLIVLAAVCCLSSCRENENEIPKVATFRFNVSDLFIFNNHPYLLFLSDYKGEVLAIEQLHSRGVHELQVPERSDGIYHVTLFDGKNSFDTYANVSPDDYDIDVFIYRSYEKAGTHSVLFAESSMSSHAASSQDMYYGTYVSEDRLEMSLTKPTSDLYVYFNKNNELRYLYYPEIKVGQSTTLDNGAIAESKAFRKDPVTLDKLTEPVSIVLLGSIDANDQKMEYTLSSSGPFDGTSGYVYVPETSVPTLSFFTTIYSTNAGQNRYAYTGPQIATQCKTMQLQKGNVSTTAESISYSLAGDATYVKWDATGIDCSWSVISPSGNNVKINLPKLPDGITIGYGLKNLNTLKFSPYVYIHKDTRFPAYLDYVKSDLKKETVISTSGYETFYQMIDIRP